MKKTVFLFLTIATVLQSCSKKNQVLSNNNIDPQLREIIKAKNDSLFEAMSNSSTKVFNELGSPQFNKYLTANLNGFIWPFRKGLLTTEHIVYEEFHTKNTSAPGYQTITSEKGYDLKFKNSGYESYISLLTNSYMGIDEYLITVVYTKIDNKWKIDEINAGQIGMYGKNANDFYKLGKESEDKGFGWDAFNHYNSARNLISPAEKLISYPDAEDIISDFERMKAKVEYNYKMPYVLENIKTKPAIEEIRVIKNAEGIFPIISYTTKISVSDSVALAKEFKNVKAEIKKKYKGIDYNQKYIYYRAYNVNRNGLLENNYTFSDVN